MNQAGPHTVRTLRSELRELGVEPGDVLLAHSSMKSLGYVVGGVQAVVQALLDAVGTEGTLVVPTQTGDNSDPSGWGNPPVPAAWWPVIRAESPGYDPALTPSTWMGIIPETVRTWPGAVRSEHPWLSFAAVGKDAREITGTHRLDDALGDDSPLGAVYRLGGKVLLLGVGYDTNTSLHLGEWRQKSPPRGPRGAAVRQTDGTSRWVTWTDVLEDESDFEHLGVAFEEAAAASIGPVGSATARLMSQPALVDFATAWFAVNRS
ncbi:AAC(3) family N-acetyltransferase [Acrocarpospora corrugata]|uniref:Aminoglycoside N(3)-acetyltransferase n=1 Tax=Acrocarpospora corrugata TaxID=35763 RepID=A0A5M3W2D5_9ACTN|nr:AAC(3) family N-acetyltransferase [Acrocarpospora corrugata]GES02876.1 AAC(3) family N-acetyltransferase [Acrocarpospora corrugata]